MFGSRQTNNLINKLHERALRIVLNDHISDFQALLHESNDISSHRRHIQMFVIKFYKIKNELAPQIVDSMLNIEMLLTISEICKIFNQKERGREKERELFFM